jgi:hypothetical protein
MRCSSVFAAAILRVVYVMLCEVFAKAGGGAEVEAAAVEFKCPASCRALDLILSRGLVGLAGGGEVRCWLDATVTNVTADCLHGTGVGIGKRDDNWGATGLAVKSRSSDRWYGMQMIFI